jgi:hypothetical protein
LSSNGILPANDPAIDLEVERLMGRVRGVVKVDVIKAKGLKAYDTMGKSDPLVEVFTTPNFRRAPRVVLTRPPQAVRWAAGALPRPCPLAPRSQPPVLRRLTPPPRYETRHVSNTLEPVWDETFYLPVLEKDQVGGLAPGHAWACWDPALRRSRMNGV